MTDASSLGLDGAPHSLDRLRDAATRWTDPLALREAMLGVTGSASPAARLAAARLARGAAQRDRRRDHEGRLYCLIAAAGSAIGGLLPYGLGRAGGELFLLKRVDRAKFERLRDRFERQEFLAVMIPSMMPPPTPWKLFIFASGVFEMRVPDFLLAVFAGRMVRWLALSLLVLKLGPGAVDLVARHALVAVLIVGALAVLGFAWWWIRKKRQGKLLED